jgi:hypothetical protein
MNPATHRLLSSQTSDLSTTLRIASLGRRKLQSGPNQSMGDGSDEDVDPSIQTAVPICRNLKAPAFIEREFASAGAGHAFIPIEKGGRRG